MIQFEYPELLLLAVPFLWIYHRFGYVRGPTGWLRVVMVLSLVLAASVPQLYVTSDGTDLVLVVDRSTSVRPENQEHIENLIRDIQKNLGKGDRVALVTFGSRAFVENEFSSEALHSEYTKVVGSHGSDLNEAILTALDRRVDRYRPARILVFSDGEYNGASPLFAARRCREEGIPIDYRIFANDYTGDLAVESVALPRVVGPNEPFQFNVWVTSDRETSGEIIVSRNGKEIARKTQPIKVGVNRVVFRDWLAQTGFFRYEASVRLATQAAAAVADPIPQNDRAVGVLRVEAGKKILVLNQDGAEDNLTRSLAAAQIPHEISTGLDHPLTQDSLDPYRAVILENVSANSLGRLKMERLAQFVEDLGGGLLMTGGRHSFATGGFYRSPLEELLPVSLESRKETRRARAALAIVLDRSGSMTAPVGLDKTKMDLANIGTAECVRMLSPSDMVAVIAVDSTPHVVQAMISVDDSEAIAQRILQIQSMGGGIFVYSGLLAAAAQLEKASQSDYGTRHVILFSDAADSEEPGQYKELLEKFSKTDITVSVIGLGDDTDVDAEFLKDIARRGGGSIHFTNDAEELPRLFAQDALNVTRSTFLTKDTENPNGFSGKVLPNIRSLGDFQSAQFPNVDGYNLTYLKEDATIGVVSLDENQAPLSAFWYRGLGRVATITPEVDGKYSGDLARWPGLEDFIVTHARWLMGNEDSEDIFVSLRQEGQDAVIDVELDPARDRTAANIEPELVVIPPGTERQPPLLPQFSWIGPNQLQARFQMDDLGTYRTLVRSSGNEFARGPALTLPYSPEFLPRVDLPAGDEVLAEIASLTGGSERVNVLESLEEPFRARRWISLVPWLCVLALIVVVSEVAGRRLGLWQWFKRPVAIRKINRKPEVVSGQRPARVRVRKKSRKRSESLEPSHPESETPAKPQTSEPPPKKTANVFAQAKNRAKKRMQ